MYIHIHMYWHQYSKARTQLIDTEIQKQSCSIDEGHHSAPTHWLADLLTSLLWPRQVSISRIVRMSYSFTSPSIDPDTSQFPLAFHMQQLTCFL
jgi:hypothetical protein